MKNFTTVLVITSVLAFGCGKPASAAPTSAKPFDSKPLLAQDAFYYTYSDGEVSRNSAMGKYLKEKNELFSDELGKVVASEAKDKATFSKAAEDLNKELNEFSNRFKWVLFSVAKPAFSAKDLEKKELEEIDFPAITCAALSGKDISMDELEKIQGDFCDVIRNRADFDEDDYAMLKKSVEIVKTEIAGCPAKKIVIKDSDVDLPRNYTSPCFGIYKSRLLIAASSEKAFTETVKLYAGEVAPLSFDDPDYKAMTGNGLAGYIGLRDIAQTITDFMGKDNVGEIPGQILKTDSAGVNFTLDDAAMEAEIKINVLFTDKAVADELSTMAISYSMMGKGFAAMALMQEPALAPFAPFLETIKVSQVGNSLVATASVSKKIIDSCDMKTLAKYFIEAGNHKCMPRECDDDCDDDD